MSTAGIAAPLVAHVIDELPPDGAERLLVDLMRRRSDRYRYVIVCLVRGGPLEADFSELGVPVVIIGRSHKFDLGMLFRLARWFRHEQVAVVHTHLFTADVFGRVAARLAGVRAVLSTSHNLNDWKRPWHRVVDRALAMLSSRVIGCTQEVGRTLVARDGLPPEKVVVVENGIDLHRFEHVDQAGVREELNAPLGTLLLGVVGRLHAQKGHADLLQALVEVQHRVDRPFRCLFIGEGELRGALEAEVADLGLHDVVHFTGLRRDIPRLLMALDVFVMPSRWEGLPMALLEAMACGKAVVVTAVGGVPSVIEDGVNGLMVAPEAPVAMAAALVECMSDEALRGRLGHAARACALQRYDVSRALASYEGLYDDALGHQPASAAAVAGEVV